MHDFTDYFPVDWLTPFMDTDNPGVYPDPGSGWNESGLHLEVLEHLQQQTEDVFFLGGWEVVVGLCVYFTLFEEQERSLY